MQPTYAHLTPAQARTMFLNIALEQKWFTAEYETVTMRELFRGDGNDTLDPHIHMQNRITRLFGPPPWTFLKPGDAPDRFMIGKGRNRRLIRDPESSEYNAMRGETINYKKEGKKNPRLKDDKGRQYWIQGHLLTADNISSFRQNGIVRFNYQLPIAVKRKRIFHPSVGDSVTLTDKSKQINVRGTISRVDVSCERSTGYVSITM